MTLNKNDHLQNVLETNRMAHIDELISKYKTKRTEIKEALEEKYSDNIYSPLNSGSFAKHTAINIKFDLDLVVPFKRNSFFTIEAMFQDVYDFLNDKYSNSGKAHVRKQKVSIGVRFYADEVGDEINIDVVPGRELNNETYPDTKDLNVYFNDNHWGFTKGSYTKTNIQAQIDRIKAKEHERKVIRLLKIWKNSNYENYKSFLLELISIKAFDNVEISGNTWEKLKSVMEYIRDNIIKDDFRLIDPGNSNNDIMTSLESYERTNLSNKMNTIINRIEENDENIKTYFPINEKHVKKESTESSYGIKGAAIAPSIPPNTNRFGK
jgi:hypothetical protein